MSFQPRIASGSELRSHLDMLIGRPVPVLAKKITFVALTALAVIASFYFFPPYLAFGVSLFSLWTLYNVVLACKTQAFSFQKIRSLLAYLGIQRAPRPPLPPNQEDQSEGMQSSRAAPPINVEARINEEHSPGSLSGDTIFADDHKSEGGYTYYAGGGFIGKYEVKEGYHEEGERKVPLEEKKKGAG